MRLPESFIPSKGELLAYVPQVKDLGPAAMFEDDDYMCRAVVVSWRWSSSVLLVCRNSTVGGRNKRVLSSCAGFGGPGLMGMPALMCHSTFKSCLIYTLAMLQDDSLNSLLAAATLFC